MTHDIAFVPEVEEDVMAGFTWYEQKDRGLGEEFLRLFYACVNEIPRNPFLYPLVYQDFRRQLVRRFPYATYFRIEKNMVVIVGLFHCARNPVSIYNILNGRE